LPQRRGALLLDGSGQRPAGGRERRGGRVYVLAMTPLCWIISRFPCIPSTDLRVYMLPPADQLVIANLVLRFPAAVHRSVFFFNLFGRGFGGQFNTTSTLLVQ
jgi:hypothetical protein